jgi:hypothetical protein
MNTQRLGAAALAATLAAPVMGAINLELIPAPGSVNMCDTVRVGVWAHADGQDGNNTLSTLNVIFSWDPTKLEFLGIPADDQGLLASAFVPANDPWGVNEASPPADGDAFFAGFAPPANPLNASSPKLLAELEFKALAATAATEIQIIEAGGGKKLILETTVYDGVVPGLDVTGAFASGFVQIMGTGSGSCDEPNPCPADTNNDGMVDVQDMVHLFLNWGGNNAAADINDDGVVNVQDLLKLVSAWGACQG